MTKKNKALSDKHTVFFDFKKFDKEQRIIEGYASTGARDQQGEIVLPAAISKALDGYMAWANIREMHEPWAVGVCKSAEANDKGLWIQAKIVDDDAWKKCEEGVYKGFSIGGKVTKRDEEDQSIIKEIELAEISIVDRPANPEARFDIAKAAEGVKMKKIETALEKLDEPVKTSDTSDLKKAELIKKFMKEFEADEATAKEFVEKNHDKLKVIPLLPPSNQTEAKVEKKEEKVETKEDVKKGMYCAANLASILAEIEYVVKSTEYETAIEGDSSTIPQQLRDWLNSGKSLLVDYVTEEAREDDDVDVEFVASALIGELAKHYNIDLDKEQNPFVLDVLDVVAKAGARHSTSDMDSLQAIHDHAQKMGAACDTEKVLNVSGVKPGDLAKATNEIKTLRKTIDELNTKITELGAQPAAKQPALKVVTKGEDFIEEKSDEDELTKNMSEKQKTDYEFKKALKAPAFRLG